MTRWPARCSRRSPPDPAALARLRELVGNPRRIRLGFAGAGVHVAGRSPLELGRSRAVDPRGDRPRGAAGGQARPRGLISADAVAAWAQSDTPRRQSGKRVLHSRPQITRSGAGPMARALTRGP